MWFTILLVAAVITMLYFTSNSSWRLDRTKRMDNNTGLYIKNDRKSDDQNK